MLPCSAFRPEVLPEQRAAPFILCGTLEHFGVQMQARLVLLVLLGLAACTAGGPAKRPHPESGAGGSTAGSGGAAADEGGAGGEGGKVELPPPGCGPAGPPCFALQQALVIPAEDETWAVPQIIRARPEGGLRAVGLITDVQQHWGPGVLDLDPRGHPVQASWLLQSRRVQLAAIGDDLVGAGFGTGDGSFVGIARYDAVGNVRWARRVDVPDGTYTPPAILPGGELATLAELPAKIQRDDGSWGEMGGEGLAVLRWSPEGALLAATAVARGLHDPSLLARGDGALLVFASSWGDAYGGSYLVGSLHPLPKGGLAILVTPAGEVRLLAVTSSGSAGNASVLPGGGFVVTGGIWGGGDATVVAPGQPGAVTYEATDHRGGNQDSFIAVFEDDGALRWSRRTAGDRGSGARVLAMLPDGATVLQVAAFGGGWLDIEREDGGFARIHAGQDEESFGPYAFAVYEPDGRLRLFQHEPDCGEGGDYLVRTPPESLTIATACDLHGSVTLGIGQPRETTLRKGGDPANRVSSMALYRYVDH
jgi:hypothetical protein